MKGKRENRIKRRKKNEKKKEGRKEERKPFFKEKCGNIFQAMNSGEVEGRKSLVVFGVNICDLSGQRICLVIRNAGPEGFQVLFLHRLEEPLFRESLGQK